MITIKQYMLKRLEPVITGTENEIAMYGTGLGAEEIYQVLQEQGVSEKIKVIIDQDCSEKIGQEKFGRKIQRINEVVDDIKVIIIAAKINHSEVMQRVQCFCNDNHKDILVLDPFVHDNMPEETLDFVQFLEEKSKRKTSDFIEISDDDFRWEKNDTKLIAWYLPQYYEIEVNNRYYGKGFTEWTNAAQAMPQFCGHYQPHIPYDVGYYNLTHIETLKRQVYLAKKYGIYGFCFHYYWFSGERIMEKPLDLFLEHMEIDMPFCINWANENWTCKWDGGNNEVIFSQHLSQGDDFNFMNDILPILKDKRYITIDQKPVLIIYRSDIFEQERFKELLAHFRETAVKNGLPGLYIMITTATRCRDDVRKWGADALVEFPPHRIAEHSKQVIPKGYLNPNFRGRIYDMEDMIQKEAFMIEHESKTVMRGVMTSYDNTARRGLTDAGIFYGIEPLLYRKWLKTVMLESKTKHRREEDFVFINAWNEWAEGAHLEPDLKYGYAYLHATKEALYEVRKE